MSNEITDPAFRLPDGNVIRAPKQPEFAEWALPANARHYSTASFWGFFDPQTDTGAIYYSEHGTWVIQQPVAQAQFWLHCEILGASDIGRAAAEGVAQELCDALQAKGKAH